TMSRPNAYKYFSTSVTTFTLTSSFFLFNATAPTEIYTLSLHDALPICRDARLSLLHRRPAPHRFALPKRTGRRQRLVPPAQRKRSEEHTSELQSRFDLVCRLLLEKKKKKKD